MSSIPNPNDDHHDMQCQKNIVKVIKGDKNQNTQGKKTKNQCLNGLLLLPPSAVAVDLQNTSHLGVS